MALRVLGVSSVGGACGIWNYLEMLMAHLPSDVHVQPSAEALDPAMMPDSDTYDVVFLTYHRGLHSRWTSEKVQALTKPVVIAFHDTCGEAPPDALTLALHDLADAFIVHEPCEGLPKAQVIRQGVLGWQKPMTTIGEPRPLLGTCGFNFPWKNFDRLCQVTAEAGWAILIISNNATSEDEARWRGYNPRLILGIGYIPSTEIVSRLAGCDATAFPYECANSGTSGAIRLGIAARKPVIAWGSCRQFRELFQDRLGQEAITWCWKWEDFQDVLHRVPIQRVDPGIVALAERDSWVRHGQRYAEIFRGLLA